MVVECPLCRNVTFLGASGVDGLKKNHYLANIVDKLQPQNRGVSRSSNNNNNAPVIDYPAVSNNNNNPPAPSAPPIEPEAHSSVVHSVSSLFGSLSSFIHGFLPNSRSDMDVAVRANSQLLSEFVSLPVNIASHELDTVFQEWAQGLWFAPTDFSSNFRRGPFGVVYIPFWKYEVSVTTSCEAKIVLNDAEPQHALRANYEHLQNFESSFHHTYPKLMICAPSPSSPAYDRVVVDLVDGMTSLDNDYPLVVAGSVPNTDPLPTIWSSQPYSSVWSEVGEKIIQRKERERCELDLQSQPFVAAVKEMTLNINFHFVHHRLVHVPFYVCEYTYAGATYKWVCSASSGEAHGTRPYGLGKFGHLSAGGYQLLSSLASKSFGGFI